MGRSLFINNRYHRATKELRASLSKQLSKIADNSKQAVRNVRAAVLTKMKKQGANMGKDDRHRIEKEVCFQCPLEFTNSLSLGTSDPRQIREKNCRD